MAPSQPMKRTGAGDEGAGYLVLLPAMLCDEELYSPQIEAVRDLVETLPLVIAEASVAEGAAAVLRRAPARFLLAGTSYGANLALEVAATAPERVAGLWLMGCNPGPHGDPEGGRRLTRRVQAGEFDAVVEEFAERVVSARGATAPTARAVFQRMARRLGTAVFQRQNASLLGRSDRLSDLSRMSCPTLLLWGRDDEIAPVAHGTTMTALMPKSRLVVLDDCGHLPTIERPEAVTAALRAWLGEVREHRSGRSARAAQSER
jgi:pimeloyl-ACP methyl ester carboxylesterase